ncbi:MAG: hypothetical protein LBQ42_10535 [Synergistaceae bacterium]|jgi:hypothetical protein|nr:hypothetical protein [Synergistaceae bacterium]
MAQVSNLNVQINQNQINQNQVNQNQTSPGAPQTVARGDLRPTLPGIRSGTLVEGQVLSRNADGNYTVRINAQGGQSPQTLLARATVELIVGEHFRAVWDSSGTDKIPVLRLSEGELSFLSKLPLADRELANALLSRGMPLSDEVLLSVREAWRRMGSGPEQLEPLLELWARDLPMTPGNVHILSWYMGLSGEAANSVWARIRKEMKERLRAGENPVDILRDLKENKESSKDPEIAKFLEGHSLLLRAPRGDVDPSFLGAPLWPVRDDMAHMLARVFVGRVREQNKRDNRGYWQMGFAVEGSRLGFIGGNVESDGRSYNLNLYAEQLATCELLKHKRHAIRKELEKIPLILQFIGVSRTVDDGLRLLSGRGLDITV